MELELHELEFYERNSSSNLFYFIYFIFFKFNYLILDFEKIKF